jgi:hypothetical protein
MKIINQFVFIVINVVGIWLGFAFFIALADLLVDNLDFFFDFGRFKSQQVKAFIDFYINAINWPTWVWNFLF